MINDIIHAHRLHLGSFRGQLHVEPKIGVPKMDGEHNRKPY